MSTLYLVATPIGNLSDITYRAVQTLQSVDVIACEDTRHTSILLSHYQIKAKRLIATHAHNESASAEGIISLLAEGKSVAFVSDAGTPGISDPGSRLVEQVRSRGYSVVPIPGASALTALVSVAGVVGKTITFEGFLSPKSGRRKRRLEELLGRQEAFVLYESPFRILKTLEAIADLEPERTLIIGREMTKKFEEFLSGTAAEVLATLSERASIKGEFALLVKGALSDNAP
ncbi:MAG TPA: 16S rRNA (cytidine(1402)-2'-O)-methyltransferase [Sphaerochaeta sp.]|nr:16S rRNA (cytidine(1402)-2'-O)-methyltransferase [Sphaerochaeta sp.]